MLKAGWWEAGNQKHCRSMRGDLWTKGAMVLMGNGPPLVTGGTG